MQENFPKAEEICKIVAACRKAGVVTFKCGPLEVTFGRLFDPVEPAGEAGISPQPITGPAPTPAEEALGQTIQAQEQAEAASIEEQGINARERQVAELLITDPLLAEEMMEREELEPIGESTDGTSGDEGETLD